ncbi:MAG: CDP-glycerol glycerophosphotransferase family protein [Lachnospiraceae bacterium]
MSDKCYEKELRALFIKIIYPKVYNKESQKEIEHKVVFMEKGTALSPSLTYMRNYVKKNTDYAIKEFALQIRAVPNEVYYDNAKEFIKEIATAKAVFICTANDLMGYFELRPETKYIQLWHGCGAFKKVGLSTIDKKFGKSAASHKEYPLNTNYSYVTIASPEVSWIFEESMGIDKEAGIIVPTGISRTDEFFDAEYRKRCYEKIHEIIPQTKEKKIILYAPTFRGSVAGAVSPDKLDVEKFYNAFHDEYILIFKHHQVARTIPEIPEKYKDSFAFDMTRGKGMTINDLMTVADIMITDYSSVVFEYCLFERPMAFFTYDLDEYIDERGLYYDFDEVTPGPLCTTNEELIDYIENVEIRFDKQEVIDFKKRFMSCCDGHSSERIWNLVEEKSS